MPTGTFGCKHCTTVHEYVALARCGDRTCPECRQVDYHRMVKAYAPQLQKLGKHGLKLVTLTQKNQRAGKRLKSIQVPAFQVCEQELSFFFARALRMILRRWRAST